MKANGIRFRTIGRIERLPASVRAWIEKRRGRDRGQYRHGPEPCAVLRRPGRNPGGDQADVRRRRSDRATVTEEVFSVHLDTAGLPDPDLIIRTSGEKRISNFLLWQAAYAELYFTDTLWPDFEEKDLLARHHRLPGPSAPVRPHPGATASRRTETGSRQPVPVHRQHVVRTRQCSTNGLISGLLFLPIFYLVAWKLPPVYFTALVMAAAVRGTVRVLPHGAGTRDPSVSRCSACALGALVVLDFYHPLLPGAGAFFCLPHACSLIMIVRLFSPRPVEGAIEDVASTFLGNSSMWPCCSPFRSPSAREATASSGWCSCISSSGHRTSALIPSASPSAGTGCTKK